MDNRIIYLEWPSWIYAQQNKEMGDNILRFTDKPSKRKKWMIGNLIPCLFHNDESLFTGIERATVFYRAYYSLKRNSRDESNRKSNRVYKWSDDIKDIYCSKLIPKHFISLDELKNIQQEINQNFVSCFPPSSWYIHLPFTLRKPYISRDDTDFYIIDNPVKKEWVFKVPYIAASQWKGALRSAMVRDLVSCLGAGNNDVEKFNEERLRLFRLFGNEKDGTSEFLNRVLARYSQGEDSVGEQADQDTGKLFKAEIKRVNEVFKSDLIRKGYRQGDIEGFQGSLHFYPTYFDQIGLEVINPHDRKTGAGKNPIYFECVPEGTKGVFNLLYVVLVGPELNSEKAEEQAKQDLKAAARGVKSMITRYGFGAKTSSGFGVADVGWEEASIRPEDEEFQAYWEEAWREDLA